MKKLCVPFVGDNKTQGLIFSRLYTEARTYLVVAVENASVLLPPAYLVRIAGYKLAWENVPGGEYFKLRDGYGEPVAVQEDDDLLFLVEEYTLESGSRYVSVCSTANRYDMVGNLGTVDW